jgi:hypothetical protein
VTPAAIAAAALLTAATPLSSRPFSFEVWRPTPRHPEVLLAPRPGGRAAAIIRFHAGAADDGDSPGLTRLAQLALLRGNVRLEHGTLIEEVYASGGTLTVTTDLATCDFRLEAGAEEFDRLARLLLQALLAPELRGGRSFEDVREKGLRDERESGGGGLLAAVASLAARDPAYGNPIHGEQATLEGLTLADVRRHVAELLSPANATVVLAGRFDPGAARRVLAPLAGGSARPRSRPGLQAPFGMQVPSRREMYLVAFEARFEDAGRVAAARLAAAILGERMHETFRARGVGYSELALAVHTPWLDAMVVGLPAHDPSELPLGTIVEELIASVRDGEVEAAELARNRGWVLGELERIDRDAGALAAELAAGAGGPWYGPGMVQALRELDRDAFAALAQPLFANDAAVRVLFSPRAARRGPLPESFWRSAAGRDP